MSPINTPPTAVGGVLIGLITEYYTGGSPVKKIAESGETGSATVMISGLSVGMQSVVIPIVILAGIILVSTQLSGIYGVGIAAVGMLATVGITMAIDAYGPICINRHCDTYSCKHANCSNSNAINT